MMRTHTFTEPRDPMVGQLVHLGVGKFAEVWAWSDALDIAAAHRLNMEGEQSGRDIMFRPSNVAARAHSRWNALSGDALGGAE